MEMFGNIIALLITFALGPFFEFNDSAELLLSKIVDSFSSHSWLVFINNVFIWCKWIHKRNVVLWIWMNAERISAGSYKSFWKMTEFSNNSPKGLCGRCHCRQFTAEVINISFSKSNTPKVIGRTKVNIFIFLVILPLEQSVCLSTLTKWSTQTDLSDHSVNLMVTWSYILLS